MEKLILECIGFLRLRAEEKGISLVFQEPTSPLQPINTDPNRLKQIVINLISNAVKYTEVGSVTVCVKENLRDRVEVHVIDTGSGMSQSSLQKLFMPFTKIMENRHLNREGVGMGLTICMKIAKALNGDIKVSSQEGVGSCFSIHLPKSNEINYSS